MQILLWLEYNVLKHPVIDTKEKVGFHAESICFAPEVFPKSDNYNTALDLELVLSFQAGAVSGGDSASREFVYIGGLQVDFREGTVYLGGGMPKPFSMWGQLSHRVL